MKNALTLLFLMISLCYAIPRGTTHDDYTAGGVTVGHAQPAILPHNVPSSDLPKPMSRDEWVCVDSLHFDTIMRAGCYMGLQYSPVTNHATTSTNLGVLIPESLIAVQKSPSWVRPDLVNVLNQLTSAKQQIWAGVINNAVDPYIDEIAFSIAHSSIQYLSTNYANPLLMSENASMIYQVDTALQYVEIIDYGTSSNSDDYYTTTRYRRMNADSTVTYVEVPRDIYYWYIVHPKITDEIPAFIDPTILESNSSHVNNIVAPPAGKFWRSFLYTASQDSMPILSEVLASCQTLRNWYGTDDDAISAIQGWINGTMTFNSNSERPHQPVRIYQKHMGRCGEYADYTTAASRIALIPCTSILSASTDHTWNEFWDEDWVQWEPVNGYINVPMVYENGWGKIFGSVFSIRSDGFLDSVTDRYSEGLATINIIVVDSLQHPVDGARIYLMMNDAGTMKFDMWGITGNNGICVFPVGENRHFAARVDSPIGSLPELSGEYLDLVDNTTDSDVYTYQFVINNAMLETNINLVEALSIDPGYRLTTTIEVSKQILCGTVMWDDITSVTSRPFIYKPIEIQGNANFIVTDSDNIMFYQISLMADAYDFSGAFSQETGVYTIPSATEWYAAIDNVHHLRNAQYVTGSVKLEQFVVGNNDSVVDSPQLNLYPNYPNPFNPSTTIKFHLSQPSKVNLSIYNIRGQKITTLVNEIVEAGLKQVMWNGKDAEGNSVGSGVYLFRLDTGEHQLQRKMIMLK